MVWDLDRPFGLLSDPLNLEIKGYSVSYGVAAPHPTAETQYIWFDDRACRHVIMQFGTEPHVCKEKYWFDLIYTLARSDTFICRVTGYGFNLSGWMSRAVGLQVTNWVPWWCQTPNVSVGWVTALPHTNAHLHICTYTCTIYILIHTLEYRDIQRKPLFHDLTINNV